MVFLPESFDFIEPSKDAMYEKTETLDGHLMGVYRHIARSNRIWLSLGGLHRRVGEWRFKAIWVKTVNSIGKIDDSEKRVFNSHIVIDDRGDIKQVYDKLHLFEVYLKNENTVMRESEYITHGRELNMPLDTPVGIIGNLIVRDLFVCFKKTWWFQFSKFKCYDLRFPQQSTLLRKLGAQILTYPR